MHTGEETYQDLHIYHTVPEVLGVPVSDTIQYLPPPRWNINAYHYHQLVREAYEEIKPKTRKNKTPATTPTSNVTRWIVHVPTSLVAAASASASTIAAINFSFTSGLVSAGVGLGAWIWTTKNRTKNSISAQETSNKKQTNSAVQRLRALHAQGGLLLPLSALGPNYHQSERIYRPDAHPLETEWVYDDASTAWLPPTSERPTILGYKTSVMQVWDTTLAKFQQHKSLHERINAHGGNLEGVRKQFQELFLETALNVETILVNQQVLITQEHYQHITDNINQLTQLASQIHPSSK